MKGSEYRRDGRSTDAAHNITKKRQYSSQNSHIALWKCIIEVFFTQLINAKIHLPLPNCHFVIAEFHLGVAFLDYSELKNVGSGIRFYFEM